VSALKGARLPRFALYDLIHLHLKARFTRCATRAQLPEPSLIDPRSSSIAFPLHHHHHRRLLTGPRDGPQSAQPRKCIGLYTHTPTAKFNPNNTRRYEPCQCLRSLGSQYYDTLACLTDAQPSITDAATSWKQSMHGTGERP
jgi:hypothetical protein